MILELDNKDNIFYDKNKINFNNQTEWHNIVDRVEYYLLNKTDEIDRADFLELFIRLFGEADLEEDNDDCYLNQYIIL